MVSEQTRLKSATTCDQCHASLTAVLASKEAFHHVWSLDKHKVSMPVIRNTNTGLIFTNTAELTDVTFCHITLDCKVGQLVRTRQSN